MRCNYIRAVGATFFPEAHSHCADAFIAVARPVGADETITAERINPFPTTVDFRADKTVAMGEQCSPLHGAVQDSAPYLRYAKRHGFVSSSDTGQPEITVSVGAVKRC